MGKLFLTVSIVAAGAALGCHHAVQPALTPEPNADSLAAARARQDSLARLAEVRATQDSLAAMRHADSLAALRREADSMRAALGSMIHFAFDKSMIQSSDTRLLDQKVSILEANPGVRVQIAGNCDERGSDEYNLALGNRRAITAKSYLVNHGIAADRIETVSYGKEKPVDPGHTEVAWAKDRNDQFIDLSSSVVLKTP